MPQLLLPRRVGCCPCRNRVNRYVPLALTLLGPIIVNTLLISGRPDSTDKGSLKGVAGSNSPSRSDFLRHQVSASHYCPPVSTPSKQVSRRDRKSTRLNSSHTVISYAVF